jgi:hypothetical protein
VAAAGAGPALRLRDGAVTGLGLLADSRAGALLLGGVLVVALLLVARRGLAQRQPPLWGTAGAALTAVLYAVRFSSVGFVPGFFPTAPLSASGVVGQPRGRARALAVAALLALPAVWLLQWTGQLVPQWGGRYVLLSGALLTVVGATALESRPRTVPAAFPAFLVAAALAVGAYGAVWHAQRTRGVARAMREIERVPRDVVTISRIAHLGREGGAWYGRNRWMNGGSAKSTAEAAAIATDAHVATIEVVELDDGGRAPAFQHWRETGRRSVPFLGFRLRVTRYAAA